MSYSTLQTLTSNVTSVASDSLLVGDVSLISVQATYTNQTPAAKTFADADVDPDTEVITITAHGYSTGLLGRLTTSGVLPAGLALATDYFVIAVDEDSIKLASSYANALAGTAVDIAAAAGGGTHTFTATALSASVKLQSSVDGVNWIDISGKTANITATGSSLFSLVDFAEPMLRTYVTQTSGQGVLDLSAIAFLKK